MRFLRRNIKEPVFVLDGVYYQALQIVLRTLAVKKIRDPGTSLISGTAGIAHLYNQFYQYYHLPEFKESAVFWLNKTMKILKEQEHDRPAEYGLIDGLAGTVLVLLSSVSEDPPSGIHYFLCDDER